MIKNYKIFKESLLNKLIGPTEDEILKSLEGLSKRGYVLKSCKINYVDGVKNIIEKNPRLITTIEYEAIAFCCINGSIDVIKYLDKFGLNLKIKNNRCVKFAIENGNIDIVKYYIDNGYFTEVNDETYLYRAISYYKFDILNLLLDNGWVVNDRLINEVKRINHVIKKDLGEDNYEMIISFLINKKNETIKR